MNTSKYTIPVMIITIIIILSVLLLISKKITVDTQDISTNKQDISTNKQDISTIESGRCDLLNIKTTTDNTAINDGFICHYVRVKNTVTISGRFDLTNSTIKNATMSGLPFAPLPVPWQSQSDGFVNSSSSDSFGLIRFDKDSSDTTTDDLTLTFYNVPSTVAADNALPYFFSFTYEIKV